MKQIFLFIDGENFRHKVEEIFRFEKIRITAYDFPSIALRRLLDKALKSYRIHKRIYYSSKIHEYPDTKQKSLQLISDQRRLKTNIEKQGFTYVIAGNVRGQKISIDGKVKYIFREKGVDVRIAVDMIALAADGNIGTAILCSSDSDLQPAVAELKKRNVKVIYLGFKNQPNKGLIYTAHKTILFGNKEIIASCKK